MVQISSILADRAFRLTRKSKPSVVKRSHEEGPTVHFTKNNSLCHVAAW